MLKPIIFRNLFFISIGLILINSLDIKAQNINDALRVAIPGLGSNARALGMGNSYIGLSDDGSASFFNPAGLGLLKRLEFSGGLSHLNYNNDVEFFDESTSYSNSNTALNRVTFAFPFPTLRGSLVFGLSYHTTKDLTSALKFDGFNEGDNSWIRHFSLQNNDIPYNLFLSYPLFDADTNYIKDTTNVFGMLNQSGSILTSGTINNWTFSGAVEVYKGLYLGLNLNIISGSYESNHDYMEEDTRDVYQGQLDPTDSRTEDFKSFYINRIINWDISGWDAKFGFLYQLEKYARFGFTVQFPKIYNINEEFFISAESEFANNQIFTLPDEFNDQVEYKFITPLELGLGVSVNFEGLIFSTQSSIVDYSQIEFENEEGLDEGYVQMVNKNIKDKLKSVFNYNVGIEYNIPKTGLRVRGGFFVLPSPYQDDPSEFNRKYATAGIGFLTDETIGIDLAFAHGWWKDFGDNYGSDVSRTFQDVTSDQFILTGTYRF